MSAEQGKLSEPQIRKILMRNPGSQAEVARMAGVTRQAVNGWVKRRGSYESANIAQCAEAKALECLEIERIKKSHAA